MKFTSRTTLVRPLFIAILGVSAAVWAAPPTAVDGILVGSGSMTLYTYDNDNMGSGKSMCNGSCATNWPPMIAVESDTASGDFTIITRDDAKKQWAVKGKPLYYWAKDAKPGDKTGEGINKLWHTVKP